jgi:hypothetical protein
MQGDKSIKVAYFIIKVGRQEISILSINFRLLLVWRDQKYLIQTAPPQFAIVVNMAIMALY